MKVAIDYRNDQSLANFMDINSNVDLSAYLEIRKGRVSLYHKCFYDKSGLFPSSYYFLPSLNLLGGHN